MGIPRTLVKRQREHIAELDQSISFSLQQRHRWLYDSSIVLVNLSRCRLTSRLPSSFDLEHNRPCQANHEHRKACRVNLTAILCFAETEMWRPRGGCASRPKAASPSSTGKAWLMPLQTSTPRSVSAKRLPECAAS